MKQMKRILMIEDDEVLGQGIKDLLHRNSFFTEWRQDVPDGLKVLEPDAYDLLILDIMLPTYSGIELCKNVRMNSDIPILFLSSCEDENTVIKGLEYGGDDYVIKPFRSGELLARIHALLRRKGNKRVLVGYESDGMRLNLKDMTIDYKDEVFSLPPMEWKILCMLVRAGGQIVFKEEICQSLWQTSGEGIDENTLRVKISRLRSHLSLMNLNDMFESCRGIGYRWLKEVVEVYES